MSISSKTISAGMSIVNKTKYAYQQTRRQYGSPIQLEDFVYYYLTPTAFGREESLLQREFHSGRINIERLLCTDLDQFTLDALQFYVANKPDTFANFATFSESIINLKKLCDDLATNEAKKKLEERELASTETKTELKSDVDLITKNKFTVFEVRNPSSYTTFNAIKCVWVIYELLKKKYNNATGQMTLEEVNLLFEDKIRTLKAFLSSRCTTIDSSAFTMTEYKEMLSIGDIGNYMGERRGGKTRKRRLFRRRRHRCKTRSKAKY
jgi:hypothetical protein